MFYTEVFPSVQACTYFHLFLVCFFLRVNSACKITHVFLELSQYHLYFSTVILHVDIRRRDILMIWFGFVALLFISEYCMLNVRMCLLDILRNHRQSSI
jgi:hypothetical protein